MATQLATVPPGANSAAALELAKGAALEQHETAGQVLAEQAKALVQARYIMAVQRPRDWDLVRQKILKDCERPGFAEAATYKKPIGRGTVSGLSIRFAESARRSMGNIEINRTIVYDDATKRVVRLSVTDLESNNPDYKDITLEKTVERRDNKGRRTLAQRLNSTGEMVYLVEATEDELLTKESAISSKIERQLTLKILPGDIQDEALRTIRHTQEKADKADPDAAKKRLVDAFEDLGIRVPDLKAFLGDVSLDAIQPSDLKQLREVYTAIKEGETTWRDVMEQRATARGGKAPAVDTSKAQSLVEKVKAKRKEKPEPPAEPAPKPEPDARLKEIFGLLCWNEQTQEKWLAANADLSADEQADKLRTELNK
jgi:hypothetical protein